jgi:hypothetical protein
VVPRGTKLPETNSHFAQARGIRPTQNGIREPDRTEILTILDALEAAQNQPSFLQRYTEFISFASNHVTVIAPFMPALAELLRKIAGSPLIHPSWLLLRNFELTDFNDLLFGSQMSK